MCTSYADSLTDFSLLFIVMKQSLCKEQSGLKGEARDKQDYRLPLPYLPYAMNRIRKVLSVLLLCIILLVKLCRT